MNNKTVEIWTKDNQVVYYELDTVYNWIKFAEYSYTFIYICDRFFYIVIKYHESIFYISAKHL